MVCENYILDCYAVLKDDLSLHSFENVNVKWINEVSQNVIIQYDFIICGRNCFDYLPADLLIDYPGIIFTDDTAFYEGRNVYGDVVFVNGNSNLTNLGCNNDFKIFVVGCLKAGIPNQTESDVWKRNGTFDMNVLYIESGHYPFGVKGRRRLAESFANAITQNPDCLFVVKPRFLLGEAEGARHRNEDYLYYYVSDCFRGQWPDNLIWLEQYYSINELLPAADVVIHTYSSAHSEAAVAQKKIINIADLSSEETADFRHNRFGKIASIIDKAGNNVAAAELAKSIKKAKKADRYYAEAIGYGYSDPAGTILKIIKTMTDTDHKCKKIRRLRGYFYKIIGDLENRFDNYEYFTAAIRTCFSYLDENYHDTEACIKYMNEKKKEFTYMYIRENWSKICGNIFDRAYVFRIYYENKEYGSIADLLDICYGENEKDATFYFFKTVSLLYDQKYDEAKKNAQKYIEHMETIKYEKLDSENQEYLHIMKGVLDNESNSFYAN